MREGEINWDSTARWKLFMLLRLGSFEFNWKWKKEKRSRDLRGLRKLLGLTFHLFHWRGIMTALRPGVCWHGLLCLTSTSSSTTSSCCCCRLSSLLHAAAYSLSSMAWDLSPRHCQEIVFSPFLLLVWQIWACKQLMTVRSLRGVRDIFVAASQFSLSLPGMTDTQIRLRTLRWPELRSSPSSPLSRSVASQGPIEQRNISGPSGKLSLSHYSLLLCTGDRLVHSKSERSSEGAL